MIDKREAAVQQLQEILNDYMEEERRNTRSEYGDRSTINSGKIVARSRAAIDRIAGSRSTYMRQFETIIDESSSAAYKALLVIGIVEALKADVQNGCIDSLIALAHADVFSDYLDMADHLLTNGYKDPAAVIIGSTLESHLRRCASRRACRLRKQRTPVT